MNPAATVLIPTHDHAECLRHSIGSVLDQTLRNFELLVVGDGVQDPTRAIIAELSAQDSRIRFFDLPKGARKGERHRHAVLQEHATGRFVAYLGDDDVWMPNHLEVMANLLEDADFGHTLHVGIEGTGELVFIPADLENPEFRARMLNEPFNCFDFTFGGHSLEAYRRLRQGWEPPPPDCPWSDLHSWRQFLAQSWCRAKSAMIPTGICTMNSSAASFDGSSAGGGTGEAPSGYEQSRLSRGALAPSCHALFRDGGLLRTCAPRRDEERRVRRCAPMKIDLYTRCWNEAEMLGFFFRHYDRLVDRYIVYDDGSSDASPALLRANPKADVRPTPPYSDLTSRTVSELADFNNFWKESRGRADWVIVVDVDEHLYHPDLGRYLQACSRSGVTVVPALGYTMLSDEFPADDVLLRCAITSGAPDIMMSKLAIFSPDAVAETNFAVGRHTAEPEGDIVAPPRDELLLLHYKYLSFERTFRRNQESRSRQRGKDIEMGWGIQYSWTREQLLDRWNNLAGKVVDVADPTLRPEETHTENRWWSGCRRVMAVEAG